MKLYDFYDRTGFGNASKADIRRFRDPTCDLMRGRATYLRVKSAQNDSLRRVRFNPTLDVLRYDDEKPILETQVQGERTSTLAPVAAQGKTITTLPSFSTTFKQKEGITKRRAGRLWHLDWGVMGHETLGIQKEKYALVVLDNDSRLLHVKCTKTRAAPWQHLESCRWRVA